MPHDPGWGYVAQSQSHPHIVKVGKTRQRARKRMAQLDDDPMYGAFRPWRCIATVYSRQHSRMEAHAHTILRRHRFRFGNCMELFETTPERAHSALLSFESKLSPKKSASMAWFLLGVLIFLLMAIGATR